MGSSVMVWSCSKQNVQFNQDLNMLSDDIPVKYESNGQVITAFADPRSFTLKNSSKLYPLNSILSPMYKIQDQWYCNNGRISMCDAPEKFHVDTTAMKEAIESLGKSTKYSGGLSDEQV